MSSISSYYQQYQIIKNFSWNEFHGTEVDLNKALNGKLDNKRRKIVAYSELNRKLEGTKDAKISFILGIAFLLIFTLIPTIIVGTYPGGFNEKGITIIAVSSGIGTAISAIAFGFAAYDERTLYQMKYKKLSPVEIKKHKHAAFDPFTKKFKLESNKRAGKSSEGVKIKQTTLYGTFTLVN